MSRIQELISDPGANKLKPFLRTIVASVVPEELRCPLCDDIYVHFEGPPEKINGKDGYLAAPEVRGNVLAIPMWCENGHHFVLCLGEHKGNMQVWCVEDKERQGEGPDE